MTGFWSVLWWMLVVALCEAAGIMVCVSSYLRGPVQPPPASPAAWWSHRSWPAPLHWWKERGWPAGSSPWVQLACSSWGEEASEQHFTTFTWGDNDIEKSFLLFVGIITIIPFFLCCSDQWSWRSPTLLLWVVVTGSLWCWGARTALSGKNIAIATATRCWKQSSTGWMRVRVKMRHAGFQGDNEKRSLGGISS